MNLDKIIAILQKTNDGDDLTPSDLHLCQLGCNGQLNERGNQLLDTLHTAVEQGTYRAIRERPLHGTPFLTKDSAGYVFWRGTRIEHFSFPDSVAEAAAARALSEHCQMLEVKGFPVNSRTVLQRDLLTQAPANTPWREIALGYYSFMSDASGIPAWCIVSLPNARAMGVPRADLGLPPEYAVATEFESGSFQLFHKLQRAGYKSTAAPTNSYSALTQFMARLGVTPAAITEMAAAAPEDTQAEEEIEACSPQR